MRRNALLRRLLRLCVTYATSVPGYATSGPLYATSEPNTPHQDSVLETACRGSQGGGNGLCSQTA
eukprot:3882415-Rhodomonas_salina.1